MWLFLLLLSLLHEQQSFFQQKKCDLKLTRDKDNILEGLIDDTRSRDHHHYYFFEKNNNDDSPSMYLDDPKISCNDDYDEISSLSHNS